MKSKINVKSEEKAINSMMQLLEIHLEMEMEIRINHPILLIKSTGIEKQNIPMFLNIIKNLFNCVKITPLFG